MVTIQTVLEFVDALREYERIVAIGLSSYSRRRAAPALVDSWAKMRRDLTGPEPIHLDDKFGIYQNRLAIVSRDADEDEMVTRLRENAAVAVADAIIETFRPYLVRGDAPLAEVAPAEPVPLPPEAAQVAADEHPF